MQRTFKERSDRMRGGKADGNFAALRYKPVFDCFDKIGEIEERRIERCRPFPEYCKCGRLLPRAKNGNTGFNDTRFFRRDERNGMAEIFAVFKLNRRQHGYFRLYDVGSVKPAPHAGFKHRPVEPLLPEQYESGHRYQFKPARLRFSLFTDMRHNALLYGTECFKVSSIAEKAIVFRYPLAEVVYVRRSVEAGLISCLGE